MGSKTLGDPSRAKVPERMMTLLGGGFPPGHVNRAQKRRHAGMRVALCRGGPADGKFFEATGREICVRVQRKSSVFGVPVRLVFAVYRRGVGRTEMGGYVYDFVRERAVA